MIYFLFQFVCINLIIIFVMLIFTLFFIAIITVIPNNIIDVIISVTLTANVVVIVAGIQTL